MFRLRSLAVGLVSLAIVVPVAWVEGVHAGGTILVSTTGDELNTDGDCSLREAIAAVNSEAPVDACPGSPGSREIFLDPGTYALSLPGAEEDGGATGDLDVLRGVSIQVNPATTGQAIIDGGGLDRIFDVHPSAIPFGAFFQSVVLRNGDAGTGDGGAIRVSDVVCDGSPGSYRGVDLLAVVLDGNRAARGGGLHVGSCNLATILYSSIVANTATDVGGGVSILGNSIMSIDTSTISGNVATVAGGGVWSDLAELNWDVRYSTVAHNRAADGGGIWSSANTSAGLSVLAENDGGNCGGPGGGTARGVSDDTTCGSQAVSDAGLGPLTSIRGMPVYPLSADSPAIEAAGVPSTPWCNDIGPSDQVGNPRPVDGDGDGEAECDAGAIEAPAVAAAAPSPTTIPNTATATPAGKPTPPSIGGIAVIAGLATLVALRARLRKPA